MVSKTLDEKPDAEKKTPHPTPNDVKVTEPDAKVLPPAKPRPFTQDDKPEPEVVQPPAAAEFQDKDARARDEDADVIDGPAPAGVPAANKSLADVYEEGRQAGAYGAVWGTHGPNPYLES